jgi:peptidoglycan/LPS O-acetylase OafA/YrhL
VTFKGPTLADRLGSRDNAVTLLRLGFALIVVLGHSFEVGGYGADPLRRACGITCGEIGVNAFFAMSGFLVTQSWLRSRSSIDFFGRRSLRIFPGFWACLLVTGLGLFPWLWSLAHRESWLGAFADAPFFRYISRNALLRVRQASIGDLFAANPASGVANGSLWSLFPEFVCYIAVGVAGLLGFFRPTRRSLLWLASGFALAAEIAAPLALARLQGRDHDSLWYLWRMDTQATFFAFGSLACVYSGRLSVGYGRAAAALGALGAAAWAGHYAWFAPVILPYLVLQMAAMLPGSWLDRVGDYSYGIYVYHYPVQQTLVFFHLSANAWGFFALTLAFALPAAFASWHLIEKPALALRGALKFRAARA